jgi:hypothetical protein
MRIARCLFYVSRCLRGCKARTSAHLHELMRCRHGAGGGGGREQGGPFRVACCLLHAFTPDWARRCHICAGTWLAAVTSAPALGSPVPHLHRDWARGCHSCAGIGLTPATSAPGLVSPLPTFATGSAANTIRQSRGTPPLHAAGHALLLQATVVARTPVTTCIHARAQRLGVASTADLRRRGAAGSRRERGLV